MRQPMVQRAERSHAARMKAHWRRDPFVKGFTVALDADTVRANPEKKETREPPCRHYRPTSTATGTSRPNRPRRRALSAQRRR